MNNSLYGFILDEDIIFNINKRYLLHYNNEPSERIQSFRIVDLNGVQTRLLIYLLNRRESFIIDKDDILRSVWDDFGLPSSNQRLWKTMNELRKKLSLMDIPDDFITNIHGMGYSLRDARIKALLSN